MTSPAATIVIPLLRQRDDWLRRAATSALAQSLPAEVIVITSPHTPASNLALLDQLARDAPRLIVAQRTRNGFPNAVNTGIGLATTGRVGLLHSDDWLDPRAIEEASAIDADIVSSGFTGFDREGLPIPQCRRTLDPRHYAGRVTLEARAAYLTHFLLFRRDRLHEAGGLDESLGDAPGIDDFDLLWTLLESGATVGLTNRALYNFTIHDGERLTMRKREDQLRTLEKIFDKHGFHGKEREKRLEEHARWFGRPEDVVRKELRGL